MYGTASDTDGRHICGVQNIASKLAKYALHPPRDDAYVQNMSSGMQKLTIRLAVRSWPSFAKLLHGSWGLTGTADSSCNSHGF
jgi:hypothetical protein